MIRFFASCSYDDCVADCESRISFFDREPCECTDLDDYEDVKDTFNIIGIVLIVASLLSVSGAASFSYHPFI